MFSPGSSPEASTTAHEPEGQGMKNLPPGFANSPFLSVGGQSEVPRNEGNSGVGGFSSGSVPVFKPISEEAFRTGALEARSSGGGGSPFASSGDTRPVLTVADILPQLPPDVARANGAPPDQPVMISPAVLDAAANDGSGAIPLFEVFRVCPALFQVPVSPTDHRRVQLPRPRSAQPETIARPVHEPATVAPQASPFSFFAPQNGTAAPSPFAAMQIPTQDAPPRMPNPAAPSSRPIGMLPPKRPDGVPPAIPTQNDFSAVPTLQLPGAPVTAQPAMSENPFSMAFSAQPSSPAASNFVSPPKHEPHQATSFGNGEPSPFLAMQAPPAAAQAPAHSEPSPFAAVPMSGQPFQAAASHPASPKSGPLASMFASTPSVTPQQPSFQPEPSPFSAAPQGAREEPSASPFGASPFASFSPAPAPQAHIPVSPPSRSLSASRPLSMPPPPVMPEGIGETVEMPLSSIVRGNSPQDLGFDPNFIPAWITTKLPAYLVKQQAGAGEIRVDLGVVIDGTDESFRPIISHGKRGFMVKLPMNEVFHSLPQVGGNAPTPMPAAPLPPASQDAAHAPIQPTGLAGLPNAFALGSCNQSLPSQQPPPKSRPLNPEPAAPGVSGGWQSAGVPSPLFESAPPPPSHTSPFGQGFPSPSSLPVPPMPEIHPGFATFHEKNAMPSLDRGGFVPPHPAPAAPASRPLMSVSMPAPEPMPSMPPVAAPAPIHLSSGAGDREQMMLRALLGVAGRLDRDTAVRHISQLAGVEACVFVQGQQSSQHGSGSPAAMEFQRQGHDLARGLKALASSIGIGEAQTLSVNSDTRVVTFSFHDGAALGVLHSDLEPPSGLREKVALLCRELAMMGSM